MTMFLHFSATCETSTIINLLLVIQGIGTALFEEIPYDEAGQSLTGTLADYLMPGAAEMPAIKIGYLHTPTPHTEYGMKGMGEGGAVAPPAAIANAVRDALSAIGAEVNETPITPRRVIAAIRRVKEALSKGVTRYRAGLNRKRMSSELLDPHYLHSDPGARLRLSYEFIAVSMAAIPHHCCDTAETQCERRIRRLRLTDRGGRRRPSGHLAATAARRFLAHAGAVPLSWRWSFSG